MTISLRQPRKSTTTLTAQVVTRSDYTEEKPRETVYGRVVTSLGKNISVSLFRQPELQLFC